MAKKKVKRKTKNSKARTDKDESILFAFLATFLSIIGFVIAIIVKREDKYVMFYAKQGLVIFVIGAIAGVLGSIIMWIPIIGSLIKLALTILVILIWFLSWLYALSGKKKHIPVVEYWTKKIDL